MLVVARWCRYTIESRKFLYLCVCLLINFVIIIIGLNTENAIAQHFESNQSLCYVWMEGNEGRVERKWGEMRGNESCLRVFFLNGMGKRKLEGVRYHSKLNPSFLIPQNWGYLEGEWSNSTYFKKNLNCQICFYDVNLYLFW